MLTNPDGSRYALESVEEEINARCDKQDFPYLTDVLGSDWGVAFGWAVPTPEGYRANAKKAARRSYRYSWE
jgi:hypothetical protein